MSQGFVDPIQIFFSVSCGYQRCNGIGYTDTKQHQHIERHIGQSCCSELRSTDMSYHRIVRYAHHHMPELTQHHRVGEEEGGADVGAIGGEEFQGRGWVIDAGYWSLVTGRW